MSRRRTVRFGSTVDICGGVKIRATNSGRLYVTIARSSKKKNSEFETPEFPNERRYEITDLSERFSTDTKEGMVYLNFVDRSSAKRHVVVEVRITRNKFGDVGRRGRKKGHRVVQDAIDAIE